MDNEIRRKILDFVHVRPRAVAEVALVIGKNWRTADRYLGQLESEDLIKLHVFRKGGRGALKIAFWPSSISETPSAVKNFLLQRILNGVKRDDFSALDIVQHVHVEKRKVECFSEKFYESSENVDDFFSALKKGKEQILFFSGNLSFTNIGGRFDDFVALIRKKIEEGVKIHILTRVDITDKDTVKILLKLNRVGVSGSIDIRYAYQPLRCTIVDEDICYLKEGMYYYSAAVDEKTSTSTFIYTVNDRDWVAWLAKVFWHMWHGSIAAEKRLEVLEEIPVK